MRVLLHICCAPCAAFTVRDLRNSQCEITGFWYNPNIHPYKEYQKRLSALGYYAQRAALNVIYKDEYDLNTYFRAVKKRYFNATEGKKSRCFKCYWLRMETTASRAREDGFEGFSTTILYSKFQKHSLAKSIGEKLARKYKISFVYRDFRQGWVEGIRLSHELKLYRQSYCGCLFSEADRYLTHQQGTPSESTTGI